MTDAPRRRGPDRLSVAGFSITAFLLVLALLGWQLRHAPSPAAPARPASVLIRRIYVTTVVERVPAGVVSRAPRATQSVSTASAPAQPASAPVVTRTSTAK